jgi:hypothetical protein
MTFGQTICQTTICPRTICSRKTRKIALIQSTLLVIALALFAALTGCSSSSSTPPPPPITVTLSTVGSSLTVNSQTPITATVANDPIAGSVNWSCTPSASCGTFNPTTTTTGVATTYTAPATVTSGVVITATLATDSSIFASTGSISITASTTSPLAAGSYVFSLSGLDTNSVYSVSGVFTVNATGTITAGEQDYVDLGPEANDLINGTGVSTVTTTADGNLQITLVTCNLLDCTNTDANLPGGGTEILNGTITPLNPNKALITEFDLTATSSGELDLQNAAAAVAPPAGSYAFDATGIDGSDNAMSVGGVFTVDGATTISGTNSTLDVNDSYSGTTFQGETLVAGQSTVSGPDTSGRVVITLDTTDFGTIAFAGYIVDSTTIRLTETTDSFGSSTGGTAFSQGANTGTFTGSSIAGQTYVVGLAGIDSCYFLQVAAQLTFNADNSVSGFINYNDFCGPYPQTPSALVAGGTWIQDPYTGRVSISGLTDGTGNFSSDLQLYPDGNGNAMTLTMDLSDAIGGRGFLQTANAYTASNFNFPYAMSISGWEADFGDNFNAAGPVTADGVGSFSGFTDLNWIGSPTTYPNNTTTGTFTAAAAGDFAGSITGVDVLSCPTYGVGTTVCTADVFVYYLIDAAGDNIAIETDTNQMALGYFTQQ